MKIHFVSRSLISLFLSLNHSQTERHPTHKSNRRGGGEWPSHITCTPITTDTQTEKETETVCVCVRERERETERESVCVCVCVYA